MTDSHLDLSQLALERTPPLSLPLRHQRRWFSRLILPGMILAGFATLLGVAAGMQLVPASEVEVVPVIVKRGNIQDSGSVLFQAAGWIEPRPTSVRVAALTSGVVEQLLVVEGQHIGKGETVARLIATDAMLIVEQARITIELRDAELRRALADQTAARTRLENPVHLQVELGDAENALARTMTEIEKLPFQLRIAEAQVEFAAKRLAGKQAAGGAIPGVSLTQSERDHQSAEAELAELRVREPNLRKEIEGLRTRVAALRQQQSLLVEEHRRVAETTALVDSAKAHVLEARLRLQQAELALSRTEIKAPMSGRVLRILSAPGTRVMGLEELAGQNSATILEMYDPKQLQVRADVRLEDVSRIIPGAPVEIETAAVKSVVRGRVLLSTSTASVQKNTLEVKVEILDPPESVSPEMLVKASFLSPEIPEADRSAMTQTIQLFIPQSLISGNRDQPAVWIVDSERRARRVTIQSGESTPDGLTHVVSGLQITDKLIASGTENLRDGSLVQIRSEDPTPGLRR